MDSPRHESSHSALATPCFCRGARHYRKGRPSRNTTAMSPPGASRPATPNTRLLLRSRSGAAPVSRSSPSRYSRGMRGHSPRRLTRRIAQKSKTCCVVWTGDYRQCTNPCRSQRWLRLPRPRSRFGSVLELQTLRSIRNALARDRSGWGCGGEVSVAAPNATSVTVTSVSAANTGGENHRFLITEVGVGGSKERTCSPKGEGLCHSDGTWG